MSILFNRTETHTPAEMISSYWHFLRSSAEQDRSGLGPIELFLTTGAVLRGWPVGFKNQTLSLSSTFEMTDATSIAYIDVSQVVGVGFNQAHKVIRFISGGAVARSPLEKKPTREQVQAAFLKNCERIRALVPAKLYFDSDPNALELDESINLTEVLSAFRAALEQLAQQPAMAKKIARFSSIQISDSDQPALTLGLEKGSEVEIAFSFSRALASNTRELVLNQLSGLL